MIYKEQLQALLGRYTQAEVAERLRVSPRTLQFWIAEKGSKTPYPDAQRNIDELYAKLIEGKEGAVNEVAEASDHTDAYVVKKEDTLVSLAQANKVLAEANKTLADAHIIIARGNEELIALARAALNFHKPTSTHLPDPPKEEVKQAEKAERGAPFVNLKRHKKADTVKTKNT